MQGESVRLLTFGCGLRGFRARKKGREWEIPGASRDAPAQQAGGLYDLLHAVVGGFLGDDHVVDVGFAEACGGDADEAGFLSEFFDGVGSDVAHTGFEAADELIG